MPQYAEGIFEQIPLKEETGTFDFMFAGNIGAVQSVETILRAAKLLKSEPVKFHIVGGGTNLERLQEMNQDLGNVIFYGRRPLEEMPGFYGKADVMFVTLAADTALNLTLPGKVQSYIDVGKPIIVAFDGETRAVIEMAQCGYCGKVDSAEELAENVKKFIDEETDTKIMGKRAFSIY